MRGTSPIILSITSASFDWFKFQFWRFVFVQQVVAKELQTFIEFPPMQPGRASTWKL
jgi:hypothetical protein